MIVIVWVSVIKIGFSVSTLIRAGSAEDIKNWKFIIAVIGLVAVFAGAKYLSVADPQWLYEERTVYIQEENGTLVPVTVSNNTTYVEYIENEDGTLTIIYNENGTINTTDNA